MQVFFYFKLKLLLKVGDPEKKEKKRRKSGISVGREILC